MNADQMKKLQKKVAAEVAAKSKKRDDELEAEKKSILNTILQFQTNNLNRGACFCYWNCFVYYADKDQLKAIPTVNPRQLLSEGFELMGTINSVNYYMLKPEIHSENSKLLEWMKEHYAEIKIAAARANKEKDIASMLMLGDLSQKFTEAFPQKTIMDLISYVKMIDKSIFS